MKIKAFDVTGYSAGYVRGDGYGVGLAISKATVKRELSAEFNLDYYYDPGPMIDFTKTWGSNATFTFGYAIGLSKPTTDYLTNVEDYEIKGKNSTIFSVG